jgi:hypothetical protein
LELDFVVSQLHPAELEVYADGGEQVLVEFAVDELAEQGALAWVGGAVPTEESPTRTSLYSPATTGIINQL